MLMTYDYYKAVKPPGTVASADLRSISHRTDETV